jgi:hypothetical protein
VELFQRACDLSRQPGCAELGWAYAEGQGVKQDMAKGTSLLDNACTAGELGACARRGILHLDLDGTPTLAGARTARPLFERACQGGEMKGCVGLGMLHSLGLVLDQNPWFALARFQQACEGGERTGCLILGRMYIGSDEPEQDVERAGHYFDRACQLHAPPGCTLVGQFYAAGMLGMANPLGSPDFRTATEWPERGCNGGDPEGCLSLAKLLVKHLGRAPSHPRVVELRQRACTGGLSEACVSSGDEE